MNFSKGPCLGFIPKDVVHVPMFGNSKILHKFYTAHQSMRNTNMQDSWNKPLHHNLNLLYTALT
jgi:hypothetical protein